MNPTLKLATLGLAALVFLPACANLDAQEQTAADLVLKGGVVYTLDPDRPKAQAVAIRAGRIVGVGDAVRPEWVGAETRVLDLKGACVVPGLWDAHAHLLGLGLSRQRVDLVGTTSFAQVVERLQDEAASTPKGHWIQGRGWDQNDWPKSEFGGEFPTHDALSRAVPNHPVLLRRVDGHASLLNRRALDQAMIGKETKAPSGGAILRDADGHPTGVLVDAAMSLANTPRLTGAEVQRALKRGAEDCLSLGLVGIHDAGVSTETLKTYESLYSKGELAFRVYAMLRPSAARTLGAPFADRYGGRLSARAIKRSMDGALGSRGAFLLEPYSDQPDTTGLPQIELETLAKETREFAALGFQTCTHAIGDAGVRRVLDAYEQAQGDDRSLRLRVEHAQIVAPADIPRFAALGVLPSMQPTHCTSDMPWATARVGPERIRGAYAWQRLRDAGVTHLPLGSDFPVESPNPMLGFYAAVTRLSPKGTSPSGPKGWFPDQRLTRMQTLRGFTIDAAYAAFQEKDTGSIVAGKWADLAIFDRDLITCPTGALLTAQVRYTIVAGEIAYTAK
jgi:predicted amidohydrolase YtcJ